MKKVILILFLAIGFSQITTAQINFGVKGGLNYNSNSFEGESSDVFKDTEGKTGYHAGIWLRIKMPVLGWYVRPELVYTNLENELVYKTTKTTYSLQKIDIPILLGKKFFNVSTIFVGPSFQYVLGSDFDIDAISDVEADGFTVGIQFGGGIELGKLGIDVRWEKSFSDIEGAFKDDATNQKFDTRVDQFIVGISYKL